MYYRKTGDETADFTDLLKNIVKTGAVGTGDSVTLKLKVGSDDADGIEFSAYITSATVSVSTGELSVVPINFTVDGDFTEGGLVYTAS